MSVKRKLRKFYKYHNQFIYHLKEPSNVNEIGNKALNLRFLQEKGFKVPKSFTCSFEAFNIYKQGGSEVLSQLEQEISYYINEDIAYSVRSSANIEDESDKSYAGQFQTILNQKRIFNIVDSIKTVWDSVESIKTQTYSKTFSKNSDSIKMGILIQEMVSPEFSGVVFTRNPLNGLNEIIIESVEGLGEDLVQIGKTPERWVYKWGDWIEQPSTSVEKSNIINRIVEESIKISEEYGEPVDLEWAYDGTNLYWLQLREITTLKNNKLYSNKLSREFLPGLIKPLVWSVNIPMVNTAWKHIFEELIGSSARNIDINRLAHPFYYRAYFNMQIIGDIFELLGMPRDLLESLAGIENEGKDKPSFKPSGRTLYFLPRIILFCIKLNNFSKNIEKFLRTHKREFDHISKTNNDSLNEKQCVEFIDKLFQLTTSASYIVIITQLLNNFYNKLVKSRLSKKYIDYDEVGFAYVNKRLQSSDPRSQISKLHEKFNKLKNVEIEDIKDIEYTEFLKSYQDSKFTRDFEKFVSKFGFLRDSGNDFSLPSWSETPQLMLKMIIDYKIPKIKRAYEERFNLVKKYVFNSSLSKLILKRAMRYLEYRQRTTNLYSYGYGLFRIFFLKIGDIFVEKELLSEKDDIFYLSYEEIKEIIEDYDKSKTIANRIFKRKKEMLAYENLQLPAIIYDDYLPKPIKSTESKKELNGVPTSKGFYIGPVKVVKGVKDMKKIQEGDIIAIPFSDVSWTPLFAKAKAVISESGGMLSHCSIVAREYNIPAVVSVNGATRLKDNTLLAVDAYKGKISVLNKSYKLEDKEDKIEISTLM